MGDRSLIGSLITFKNVVLSPYDDQHGFIEYKNGHFSCFLPKEWNAPIDGLRHSKGHIFFNTVVQSQIYNGLVQGMADEGQDVLKGDITSGVYNPMGPSFAEPFRREVLNARSASQALTGN